VDTCVLQASFTEQRHNQRSSTVMETFHKRVNTSRTVSTGAARCTEFMLHWAVPRPSPAEYMNTERVHLA
jgi:hypothetical protein